MVDERLIRSFLVAATALYKGKSSGLTGNGLQRLDFKVDTKMFSAIQQNPNKLSTPSKMAREGHVIVQIRDNDLGILVGNVDLTTNRFNSYDQTPQPFDITDLEKEVGPVPSLGEITVASSTGSAPGEPSRNIMSVREPEDQVTPPKMTPVPFPSLWDEDNEQKKSA